MSLCPLAAHGPENGNGPESFNPANTTRPAHHRFPVTHRHPSQLARSAVGRHPPPHQPGRGCLVATVVGQSDGAQLGSATTGFLFFGYLRRTPRHIRRRCAASMAEKKQISMPDFFRRTISNNMRSFVARGREAGLVMAQLPLAVQAQGCVPRISTRRIDRSPVGIHRRPPVP